MGDIILPQQREQTANETADRSDLASVGRRSLWSPKVGPEELVCTVDQVDFHDSRAVAAAQWQVFCGSLGRRDQRFIRVSKEGIAPFWAGGSLLVGAGLEPALPP